MSEVPLYLRKMVVFTYRWRAWTILGIVQECGLSRAEKTKGFKDLGQREQQVFRTLTCKVAPPQKG
jgi:hypothetical protein